MKNRNMMRIAAGLVIAFIAAGCGKNDAPPPQPGGGEHVITGIFILAKDNPTLEKVKNPSTLHVGDRLPLRVMASWAIPSVEDVTDKTKFTVTDPTLGEVDDHGVFTARKEGNVVIEATFAKFTDRMELRIEK